MSVYNYLNFPLDADTEDFVRFPDGPKTGEKAPEGTLVDAASGQAVELEDYFRTGLTVIEFGSYT